MAGWADLFRRRDKSQHPTHRKSHRSKMRATTVALEARNLPTQDADKQNGKEGEVDDAQLVATALGVSHLGKFAHENEMPSWLVNKLAKGGQVCTNDVVPALTRLVGKIPSVEYAYFCHPCVQHVSKLRREGGFCGYRNIQSLISYIIGAETPGHEHFQGAIPSVFQIQDFIESAWDLGHNANGRAETGGIRGTRKYIGTPEAQALLTSLAIPCSVKAFRPVKGERTWEKMMMAMEVYFSQEHNVSAGGRVRATKLPPVYLQHQGHSLTVVGFERGLDGTSCLYVFDPSSRNPESVKRHGKKSLKNDGAKLDSLIEPYRRGETYLSKYKEFEVLFLQGKIPKGIT